jgi:hypothetical protein
MEAADSTVALVRCVMVQAGKASICLEYFESPAPSPYGVIVCNGFGSGRLPIGEARSGFNRILTSWYLRELQVEPSPLDLLEVQGN